MPGNPSTTFTNYGRRGRKDFTGIKSRLPIANAIIVRVTDELVDNFRPSLGKRCNGHRGLMPGKISNATAADLHNIIRLLIPEEKCDIAFAIRFAVITVRRALGHALEELTLTRLRRGVLTFPKAFNYVALIGMLNFRKK